MDEAMRLELENEFLVSTFGSNCSAAFRAELRERLIAGARDYGDASFMRAPHELLEEMQQELVDVAGWAWVLWAQQRMCQTLAAAELLPLLRTLARLCGEAERAHSSIEDLRRKLSRAQFLRRTIEALQNPDLDPVGRASAITTAAEELAIELAPEEQRP